MNNRIFWADVLRITAIVFVVLLHSAGPLLYQSKTIPYLDWQVGNFIDSATRSGVPLFIMLSGYLLLGKVENIRDFLFKRFRRVAAPYIFWSAVYIFYITHYQKIPFNLAETGYKLLTGNVYFHLIFFNYFFGIYLFVPVMRRYMQNTGARDHLYFIAVWILFASLLPMLGGIAQLYSGVTTKFFIDAPQFTGFIGFFILGFLLGNLNSEKAVSGAILAFTSGLSITILGTYLLTKQFGIFLTTFYEYASPGVLMMAISMFILIKHAATKYENRIPPRVSSWVSTLSNASFGVYFIHVIILELLRDGVFQFKLHGLLFSPFLAVPVTALAGIVFSYAIIIILSRVRQIRYFVT